MAEREAEKCTVCEVPIYNYAPEYIESIKKKFGDIIDCKIFLRNLRNDPDWVHDMCLKCLSSKWQKLKDPTHNQLRRPAPSSRHIVADATKKSRSRYKSCISIIIPLIVPALCLGYYTRSYFNENTNTRGLTEDKLRSTLISLQDKFPSLELGLQKKLSGALSRLKTPGEPIVFMLLHDDTNKNATDCLATYASVSAKKFIFTSSPQGLWMNGSEWARYSDLNHDDLLLEKLNSQLVENEVLVVENLQDLPWSLAKMLHHLCDSENPTYAKAMYVLELRVEGDLQRFSQYDKLVAAEQAMDVAWRDAPRELRQPLITRLTSYVGTALWKSDTACLDDSFIRILP